MRPSDTSWCDGNREKVCNSTCGFSTQYCRTDAEDSDVGKNYKTRGTCTDYQGCSDGECVISSDTDYCLDSNQLREYYDSYFPFQSQP